MRLILCLALILLGSGPAAAHAMLMGVEPAQGAVLDRQPDHVVLHFMQPVTALRAELIDPASKIVELAGARAAGNDLVVPVPAGLGRGTHLLRWRVLGGDPHPVSGMLTFSMQEATDTPAVPVRDEATVDAAMWVIQMALDFCLLVGIGGVFFRFWLFDGTTLPALAQRGIGAALWASALAVMAFSVVSAVQALDASWAVLGDVSALLHVMWLTGNLMKAALAVAAVAACAWSANLVTASPVPLCAGRLASGSAVILGAAAIAMEGHGAPGVPLLAAQAALFSHAISLMFWVGSLLPLCSLLLKGLASQALKRFSRVIPAFLGLLVLSGLAMASLHIGSLQDLLLSGFGLVLLTKLLAFGLLLVIAAYNRYALTSKLLGGADGAARVLASFAGLEMGLVLVIVAVAGFWRFEPPSMTSRTTIPIMAEIDTPGLWASVSLSAGFEVVRDLSLTLQDSDEQIAIRGITVTAAPVNGAVPAIRRSLEQKDSEQWEARGLYLPIPGPWQFGFTVASEGGKSLQLNRTIFITQ